MGTSPADRRRADLDRVRAHGRPFDYRDLPGLGVTADPGNTPDGQSQSVALFAHGLRATRNRGQSIVVWLGLVMIGALVLTVLAIPLLGH